ncbi:MAG: hypothetical protein Kow0098_03440 [Ignavibacteriaceae bacterium]
MRQLNQLSKLLLLLLLLFSFTATPLQETKFVGSKKSDKYHYTWCRWANKIKSSNLVVFDSVQEARNAGYVPCKVCKPPSK